MASISKLVKVSVKRPLLLTNKTLKTKDTAFSEYLNEEDKTLNVLVNK